MKILVSGIGGDIGFGAGRILKKMPSVHHIFGIDIHGDHPGISLFDQCDIAPASNDASYLAWLHDYIDRNEIDIFVPTSEPEITFFWPLKAAVANTYASFGWRPLTVIGPRADASRSFPVSASSVLVIAHPVPGPASLP